MKDGKQSKLFKLFAKMLDKKLIRKNQCILLGNLKDKSKEVSNIIVTNNAVRCLCIFIGHNKEQCYDLHWLKSMKIWKNYLNHGKRELTIFGNSYIKTNLCLFNFTYSRKQFNERKWKILYKINMIESGEIQ